MSSSTNTSAFTTMMDTVTIGNREGRLVSSSSGNTTSPQRFFDDPGRSLHSERHDDDREARADEVDAGDQAQGPAGGARQPGNDQAGEYEIDDAAEQHPSPG